MKGAWKALVTHEIFPTGAKIPVYDDDENGELVQIGTREMTKTEHRYGISRRQCTRENKIAPIEKKLRTLLGYEPKKRIPAGSAEVWIGISMDEVIRMKPARPAWQVNRWPLIEKRMSRRDCLHWLERNGYPGPPKSSCIGCPFHSNSMWRAMRDMDPVAWDDAVHVDHAIRTGGTLRGMRAGQFMHRDCMPLDQVDLSTLEDRGQLNLFLNECEGLCGV